MPARRTRPAGKRDLGAFFELVARCHGLGEAGLLRTARSLGTYCARVYLIRDSGALARKGRAVLPVEQLRGHGLSAQALTRREHRDRLPDLLAPAAADARTRLARADGRRRLPVCIRARTRLMRRASLWVRAPAWAFRG